MARHLIEAATVCINYGDFLAEVAVYNKPLLHRWMIITDPADKQTQRVCKLFGLEVVFSSDYTRNGKFDKGRLIDRSFSMLGGKDWLLHLDADVALPCDLDNVLSDAHLDESCLYGCDRLNVRGRDNWDRVRSQPLLSRPGQWMVGMSRPGVSVGARVANVGHGYAPPGFFQLWHGSHDRRYPIHHGTAARTDIQHAYQWDRRKRVLIPELLVYHLESDDSSMGANWRGRKTAPFVKGGIPTAREETEMY